MEGDGSLLFTPGCAAAPPNPHPEREGMPWEEELELIHLAIPTLLPPSAQPTLSVLLAALDDF